MLCHSFDFVASADARVLIVGSMPSVRSIERAQYYAHPRNAFWPILFDTFKEERTDDYQAQKALIRRHHLALWDAAACCEREGSLDSQMRGIQFNDFDRLYRACPRLETVLCNGAAAYALFLRSGYAGDRRVMRMPSTSPAHTMAYEKKFRIWRDALCGALEEGPCTGKENRTCPDKETGMENGRKTKEAGT